MKKLSTLLCVILTVAIMTSLCVSTTASAALSANGLFNYDVVDNTAVITDASNNISGNIEIPDTLGGYPVVEIKDYAFQGCNKITNITIGRNIKHIGIFAFSECSALQTVAFPDDSQLITLSNAAFEKCTSLKSIEIPTFVNTINGNPFIECTSLESLTVADANQHFYSSGNCILSIDTNALLIGCKSSIIPTDINIQIISSDAFYFCTELKRITIPDSVKTIDASAFESCISLTDVTLPNGLQTINSFAFKNCIRLKEVHIPTNVDLIQAGAFAGCRQATFSVSESSEYFISKDNCLIEKANKALISASNTSKVPFDGSVERIEAYAFYSCDEITEIDIPSTVSAIGSYAFYGCTKLVGIYLPSSISDIESHTFGCCSSLSSINIPENVKTIWEAAFANCIELATVSFEDNSQLINIYPSAFFGCRSLKDLKLPSNLQNIYDFAFDGCSSLASIEIPASVSHIQPSFYGCNSLTSITVDKGNKVYTSLNNCIVEKSTGILIAGCRTSLVHENVSIIGKDAFNGIYISHLSIPNGVTAIKSGAFRNCYNLLTLHIPQSVIEIDKTAFENCTSLIILCNKDSTAHVFAKENNIKFWLFEDGLTETDDWLPEIPDETEANTIYQMMPSTDHLSTGTMPQITIPTETFPPQTYLPTLTETFFPSSEAPTATSTVNTETSNSENPSETPYEQLPYQSNSDTKTSTSAPAQISLNLNCASSIAGSSVIVASVLALGVGFVKKKED